MRIRSFVALTAGLLACLACSAQSALTPQSIEAQLKAPILMLRGMYDGRTLKFDAKGNLIGTAKRLPFMMSAVRIHKVKVDGSGVRIEAEREGLEFSYGKQNSVREQGWGATVRIEIALDAGHPEQLNSALAKVFSLGLDQRLADEVPVYWRPWVLHQLDPSVKLAPTDPNTLDLSYDWEKPKSEDILPPRTDPSITVMPEEPQIAQQVNYNAIPSVGLVVDTSGNPTEIRIVQPVGMGLDEAAVKAVSGLRFKPALYKGKPVAAYIIFPVAFSADRRSDFPHPGGGMGLP